mmetsp:Transcript_2463/g.5881  ORF Transcript_2463/g.5881 Transcript_2463/m.5881 type:complete len:81 (+) Transcript_2463:744-986(+)
MVREVEGEVEAEECASAVMIAEETVMETEAGGTAMMIATDIENFHFWSMPPELEFTRVNLPLCASLGSPSFFCQFHYTLN